MTRVAFEELPTHEPIHSLTDERSERKRQVKFRNRKSDCAKSPFTRKQALTRMNQLMKGGVPFLRIYKCKCGYFHLTSQKPRHAK